MRRQLALVTFVSFLVAACGGGGDDTTDSSADRTATSASANGVIVADDSVHAQTVVLITARTVIASGSASQLVNCAGGGSAIFTATGGGSLGNGSLDTGEVYSIDFFGCRSSSGSARVTGELQLTVNSAGSPNSSDYSVTTVSDLTVELPRRLLSFDGTSTLVHTEVTTGATLVVSDRWTAQSVSATSFRNNRYTRLSLTDVDLTRRVTTTNGTVTDISDEGHLTMAYDGWAGHWSATISTDGRVRFNIDGVPLAGLWRIALPQQLVVLEVLDDAARATFPGRVLLWPILVLASLAD
jgi:hypothetical protein